MWLINNINRIIVIIICLILLSDISFSQYELKYAGSMDIIKNRDDLIITNWDDSVWVFYDYKNIFSKSAFYNQAESLLVFQGNVTLKDTINTITSDKLFIYFKDNSIKAFNNVNFFDKKNNLTIKADSLVYYYKRKYGKIFKDVQCSYNEYLIKSDSVYIFGQIDSLYFWDNVEFIKDNFLAITDFAKTKMDSSLIKLFDKPQLVMEKSFLRGNNIDIIYRDRNIDSIIVNGYATGRILSIDTLKSDTVLVYFSSRNMNIDIDSNRLKTVNLLRNSIVEYEETKSENREKRRNKLSGYFIKIEFSNDSIDNILVSKDVQGIYIDSKEKGEK